MLIVTLTQLICSSSRNLLGRLLSDGQYIISKSFGRTGQQMKR